MRNEVNASTVMARVKNLAWDETHRQGPAQSQAPLVPLMIEVDTQGEVNQKETKVQLTTTAGALDMRGFN